MFLMRPDSPWLFLGILIVFLWVLWRYYWKFQLMYNSSGVSFYTPDQFSLKNPKLYWEMSKLGESHSRTKTVVIAGLLRDVGERLPIIRKRVEKLGKMFQDYRVLVVENDSQDKTRAYLLAWAQENPKVTILGCGYNVPQCFLSFPATQGHSVNRSRIEKMAYLRNLYLQEVKTRYSQFDYLIVWDMDIVGSVYLDGVANTMGYMATQSLDAVCAYGIYQWGPLKLYYDTYATLEPGEEFHIDSKTIHDLKKGLGMQFSRGDLPVPVKSCFSGFTIYRVLSVLPNSVYYDTTPPDDPSKNLECEHVRLSQKMASIGRGNIRMNPSMIHLVILND